MGWMAGGGSTGQVDCKHRLGALRDNTAFTLLAGAFDIDAERGTAFGVELGLDPKRCYPDYRTMFREETAREDGIEAVSIATPNYTHCEITRAALEAGLHVICEKPLFFTVSGGLEIRDLAREKNRIVGVTYGFSGSQLLLQMRMMGERGDLGEIRMVELQYTHGFGNTDESDRKSAAQKWRVNPAAAGRDAAQCCLRRCRKATPNVRV